MMQAGNNTKTQNLPWNRGHKTVGESGGKLCYFQIILYAMQGEIT